MHLLHVAQAAPGPCPIVCDKGFASAGVEKAAADLGHILIRPDVIAAHYNLLSPTYRDGQTDIFAPSVIRKVHECIAQQAHRFWP